MNGLHLDISCSGEEGFRLSLRCEIPGEGVTAVYGPSGSGKSTLLDCVAGLRRVEPGGSIVFRGESWLGKAGTLRPWQRHIGYVFADARLFPHLTARDNLGYAIKRNRDANGPAFAQVVDWLMLDKIIDQFPATLSAGQQKRVAIGRALLSGPQLLLLDEPLANLDHLARRQCLQCLQRLATELALPMLYVSHEIEELSELADHIMLIDQGRLVDQGPLIEMSGRLDTRLAQEEQAAAILEARLLDHDDAYGLSVLGIGPEQRLYVNRVAGEINNTRRIRIPARDISLCRERPRDTSILNVLPVTVDNMEADGSARVLLRLALGETHLLARITRKSCDQLSLSVGDAVFAQIKSVALLSDAGGQL
ncbi:MAG: molybdenum ABC transporter ATP-binding protein [Pseudomonadota bacterium]